MSATISLSKPIIVTPLSIPSHFNMLSKTKTIYSIKPFTHFKYTQHSFITVEVPKFYNPVTTALQPRNHTWRGMKTVAELRNERNLPVPVNKDSLYKPIERKQKKFNPLIIPKTLQANLPFASKPKNTPSERRSNLQRRRALVMEPHERKVHAHWQQLQLIRNVEIEKQKLKEAEKKKAYEVEKVKADMVSKKRQREEIRGRYREQDKASKKIRGRSDV